ncbi:MAG: N-methylhydantoinase A [Gammaproteobacteria bacterium]|jgi:N-methylhydantoinase A
MNHNFQFQVGIDIGGTFTDFSLIKNDNNRLHIHKQLTKPEDLLQSVCTGLSQILTKAEADLSQVSRINHATTLVANAVLERKGDVTGLLCTKGFISVFDIGQEQRYDQYDLRIEFPKPLVPLLLRKEIGERINSKGLVEEKLVEQEVITSVRELRDKYKITSLAVCFINAYRNPLHEQQVKEIVTREFPDISISTSADVLPAIREYERWTTTIINAYTQSIFKAYLNELDSWLLDNGFKGILYLLASDGGMVNIDIARQYPVRMLASGSAATVLMCSQISKSCSSSDLLMFDMGGTTTKLGLIRKGKANKRYKLEVGRIYQNKKGSGFPVCIPAFDLTEIACGGCSIASIDQRAVLKVGPESMGASPGPACFGFGGNLPTTVDANLLLGFYGTDTFLGGEIHTNIEMAEQSIQVQLSDQLETTASRTAWGIYETVNENVVATIRSYSAERGIDYRKCHLVVSGGAAPAHALAIARKLEIEKVIIPLAAGAASAVGLLAASISFESLQSHRIALSELSLDDFLEQFRVLEDKVLDVLSRSEHDNKETSVIRHLDMRYLGQGFEVEIELPADIDLACSFDTLTSLFIEAYEKQFYSSLAGQDIEIIGWKVEISVTESNSLDKCHFGEYKESTIAPVGTRKVFSFTDKKVHEWPVYNRYALQAGDKFIGPLLIEDHECTSVFHKDDLVEVDNNLNLIASPALNYHEK